MDQVLNGLTRKQVHVSAHASARDEMVENQNFQVKQLVFKRDNSEIFYAESTAYPTPVAIKICLLPHTDRRDSQSAKDQFDALKKVSEAMADHVSYRVPKPYFLQENTGLLIMEWVSAPAMTEVLLRADCSPNKAEQLFCDAADWLKRFHMAHPLPDAFLDVADKDAELDVLAASTLVRKEIFRKALDLLHATAKMASASRLSQSWIHGDFKTDNLLVDADATIGIDVHVRDNNTVVYDVAPFLNHFELSCFHPRMWRLARVRNTLVETFVSRYFGDSVDAIGLPLLWVRIYSLLAVWAEFAGRTRSPLRQAFLNFSFQCVLRKLVKEMQHHTH